MQHFIENNELKEVKIVPFRDITAPLFNMHPTWAANPTDPDSQRLLESSQSQSKDCTHFCYFPQLWQSVWYHLYSDTLIKDGPLASSPPLGAASIGNITTMAVKTAVKRMLRLAHGNVN